MRFLAVCLMVLASASVWAQCEDCNIVRGDANCDGSVNLTDVIVTANGTWSNGDAADANDDGYANITDSVYLSHYLFQGGAAPPCPFPSPGHDCTQDGLENCCSPPIGAVTGYASIGTITYNDTTPTSADWDGVVLTTTSIGDGRKKAKWTLSNFNNCDHKNTIWNLLDATFPATSPKFTKKQLDKGILNISLNCPLDVTFTPGTVCPSGYACDGNTNYLQAILSECVATVGIGPASGSSATQRVTLEVGDTNYTYKYKRTGVAACAVVGVEGSPTGQTIFNLGINHLLKPLMGAECSEWKVFDITVESAEFYFVRTDQNDIVYTEKIEFTAFPQLLFTYCTCH